MGIQAMMEETMKKHCFDERTDLRHIDHRQALFMSRGISSKTNAQVAAAMGLGEETVARYQRDPAPGESSCTATSTPT